MEIYFLRIFHSQYLFLASGPMYFWACKDRRRAFAEVSCLRFCVVLYTGLRSQIDL